MPQIMLSKTSEHLGALLELLAVFYQDPTSADGHRAFAAFNAAVTPLNALGHAQLSVVARKFAEHYGDVYGVFCSGAEAHLEANWLLAVRLGIEIGLATERVADN